MPGMDGYEVAGVIRDDPNLSGAVLAAVTGYGDPERCKKAGFHHHFVKPPDIARMERLLAA
jgi:CheY-like chemotaxis protein